MATISGVEAYSEWPSQPVPPCAIVRPVDGTYNETISAGVQSIRCEIIMLAASIGSSPDSDAQRILDAYLETAGASSVRAAIEGDVTLGGAAASLAVTGFRDYGGLSLGGGGPEYLGVRFDVTVWT